MAVEQIGSETIKALKEALTPLAEKLGTTAEATWPVVVAQQKVDAITSAIWGVVMLVGTIGTFNWFVWANARDLSGEMNIQATVAGSLSLVAALITVNLVTSIVEKLLNPEFQAFDYFVQLIKPGSSE